MIELAIALLAAFIWLVANRNDKQIRANADRVERILIEHDSRLREVESSADTEE